MKRLIRDERGAAAVETSLILAPLFAVLMGVFFVGWAIHCSGEVRQAVTRAGRVYALERSATEATFRQRFEAELDAVSPRQVTLQFRERALPSGAELVEIQWSYGHPTKIPFTDQVYRFGGAIEVPRPPAGST